MYAACSPAEFCRRNRSLGPAIRGGCAATILLLGAIFAESATAQVVSNPTQAQFGVDRPSGAICHRFISGQCFQFATQDPSTGAISFSASALRGLLMAAQFPALTGDVVTTAGSLGTTISPGAVKAAKQFPAAAKSLRGNPTGSVASVSDNSLTSYADAETGNASRGAVYFRGASKTQAFSCPTSGYFLRFNGAGDIDCAATTVATPPQPQITSYLTAASGTYSTPSGATRLEIEGIASGQGGAGGKVTGTATIGGNGGDATFGPITLAGGGSATTSTLGSAIGDVFASSQGNFGGNAGGVATFPLSGVGGQSLYGGAGNSVAGPNTGGSGGANSGAGGGGGGTTAVSGAAAGAGGASGAAVKATISAPAAAYAWSLGTGGAGGTAGTNGGAGGLGAVGRWRVTAYFN